MKGRYVLAGLLLLLLFTVAVSQRDHEEEGRFDLPQSYDIVVVGSGIPALTAALEATRLGAEVLLLDHPDLQDEFPPPLGGRFVTFSAEGEMEADNLRLLEAVKQASPGIQEALLTKILESGPSTLAWLEREAGLPHSFVPHDPHHSYSPPFSDPEILQQSLRDSVLSRLASVVFAGEPLGILLTLSGQVEGFRYRDGDMREHTVTTGAVILASGGFLENPGFMGPHTGGIMGLPPNARNSGTGGQAFDLTRPVRARLANPERVHTLPVLHPRGSPVTEQDLPRLAGGRWFKPEGGEVTGQAGSALAAGEEGLRNFLLSHGGSLYIIYPAGQSGPQGCHYAESPGQLAELTGIPLAFLEELALRLPPPYEAGRVDAELFYNLGGVATDGEGRVLGAVAAIPGLYALGEASGALHGQGLYPGLPLSEALVMGVIVGREAALFARR